MSLVPGLISIIMSNFNTPEEYLREAIESVLIQTYDNFEFIIIDDCSTDNSLEIIRSYDDERIVILKNEKNMGITKSLNRGLSVATGEFVARMDADDICLPKRFEKQVDFLRENTDVIVCGTAAEFVGEWQKHNSNRIVLRNIPKRDQYRIHLLFGNYPNIVHSSAMFNNTKLQEHGIRYNEKYIYAQDYRMWISCSEVAECASLDDVLMQITVRDGTISTSKKELQEKCVQGIIQEQFNKLHLVVSPEVLQFHRCLFPRANVIYHLAIKEWFEKIIAANKTYKEFNQKEMQKLLRKKWAEISYYALAKTRNPITMLKILLNVPLKYWYVLFQIYKYRRSRGR